MKRCCGVHTQVCSLIVKLTPRPLSSFQRRLRVLVLWRSQVLWRRSFAHSACLPLDFGGNTIDTEGKAVYITPCTRSLLVVDKSSQPTGAQISSTNFKHKFLYLAVEHKFQAPGLQSTTCCWSTNLKHWASVSYLPLHLPKPVVYNLQISKPKIPSLFNWTLEMDSPFSHNTIVAFGAWILLQLLNAPCPLYQSQILEEDDDSVDYLSQIVSFASDPIQDLQGQMSITLHNFGLWTSFNILGDDLGFWVKPRSTTWFSQFLLEQYDDSRWVQMFRMSKPAVFALAHLLRPHIQKKNTPYRFAIPVLIRVACTLFKLAHGAKLFICSELFAIGRSTVSLILRDVVHVVNETLRHEIMWPTGLHMQETEAKFFQLCGLPGVVGAIDGTHVAISKPKHFPVDYYYFKSGGYSLNCQVVVDSDKRFLDLYLGMPGSTNDSRMLRRSSLYHLAMHGNILEPQLPLHGFAPYILGDQGYPLLPWLLIPHRSQGQLSVAEALFNRRMRKGRCVVENAFGILKQTFRELLDKSSLDVAFLPDVIVCCAILHNILLGQSHEQVEMLLHILRQEGLHAEADDDGGALEDLVDVVNGNMTTAAGVDKRAAVGVYLSTQRQQPQ